MNEIETMFSDGMKASYYDITFISQKKIGKYIADFVFGKLVVEIDGKDYHETPDQVRKDKRRDREIALKGFHVVRYSATEVYNNLSDVCKEVYKLTLAVNGGASKNKIRNTNDELWIRTVVPCKVTRIRPNIKETSGWVGENFYNFGKLICDSLEKGWDINIQRGALKK